MDEHVGHAFEGKAGIWDDIYSGEKSKFEGYHGKSACLPVSMLPMPKMP